jgi:hypothetical protein
MASASMNATPFRIHDENDYTHITSQTKSSKKGLGGAAGLPAPLGKSFKATDKSAPKTDRKVLSNLSTSSINVRNTSSVSSSAGTVIEAKKLVFKPISNTEINAYKDYPVEVVSHSTFYCFKP